MPYPRVVVTMAQNLLALTASNPDVHENKFYMLWNAILTHHFPIELDYGVSFVTSTGSRPEYLVVIKVAHGVEDIVLVVGLKRPAEDSEWGRVNVRKELVDYIERRFDETKIPTIYAIGGIGLSWVAYKMDRACPLDPFVASSNVTSATSYDAIANGCRLHRPDDWHHSLVKMVGKGEHNIFGILVNSLIVFLQGYLLRVAVVRPPRILYNLADTLVVSIKVFSLLAKTWFLSQC